MSHKVFMTFVDLSLESDIVIPVKLVLVSNPVGDLRPFLQLDLLRGKYLIS